MGIYIYLGWCYWTGSRASAIESNENSRPAVICCYFLESSKVGYCYCYVKVTAQKYLLTTFISWTPPPPSPSPSLFKNQYSHIWPKWLFKTNVSLSQMFWHEEMTQKLNVRCYTQGPPYERGWFLVITQWIEQGVMDLGLSRSLRDN